MSSQSALAEANAIDKAVQQDKGHPKPLTAEEILKHPAYDTTEWSPTPTQSGKTKVAQGRRGGPFEMAWEIHGKGPTKLVFVMGLGAFGTAWKRQTRYFGQNRGDKYTTLTFDNRGIGGTAKPSTRYSTTEMALDVIDLLKTLGWLPSNAPSSSSSTSKPKRTLNIIGISMGGMITQELALLIPEHIQSICLTSTAPRIVRTVPFLENLKQRINMFVPRPIDVQLEEIAHRLFSREFLQRPDLENPPNDPNLPNFPTNRDRFAATELHKRQDKQGFPPKGFILQAIAAGWHHKSPAQIKEMGDTLGRERIAVVHGTGDRMLTFPHFELIREDLGGEACGATFKVWQGCGHVPLWELEDEYNQFLEGFVLQTAKFT